MCVRPRGQRFENFSHPQLCTGVCYDDIKKGVRDGGDFEEDYGSVSQVGNEILVRILF